MSAFEADLARELRSIPADAPAALRERVRALGEPEPRRFPQLTWRRASVVLVPACAAALLAVAAVRGIVASGDENHGQFAAAISDNAKSNPRSEHGSSGATN